MAVVVYQKKYTETLGQMLQRFRQDFPQYVREKVTYAGRLDPMASGVMVLLTGDDVHRKQEYLNQDKIYEVQVMFGVETDSLDILGEIIKIKKTDNTLSQEEIATALAKLKNITTQTYPVYSSKTVQGKPLWQWARQGRLSDITIPHRDITIYGTKLLNISMVPMDQLSTQIFEAIDSVEGDFRQTSIHQRWKNFFDENSHNNVVCVGIQMHVSSGTYVRGLVQTLSQNLGVVATCLHIHRVKVGIYALDS